MEEKHVKETLEYPVYSIIMVDFGSGGELKNSEIRGIRPAVVISRNTINRYSDNVIVAPITKADNKLDEEGCLKLLKSQVYISNKYKYYSFLEHSSIILTEASRAISKKRIGGVVGKLTTKTIKEVKQSLEFLYNLGE